MVKFFYLAAVYFFIVSCNSSDSSKSTYKDSTNKKNLTATPVPPELIVTADQVNGMLGHYNADNGNKSNTLILTVKVGYIKTAIEGLRETDNFELIFGSYTLDDFRRRQPVYPTTPEDEVVNRACVIFRNPSTRQNYDITVKLCPPPSGPCDVSIFKELKDSSHKNNPITNNPMMIPADLQITAEDLNSMLANYLTMDVYKASASILTVNVGWIQTVIEKLSDDFDLQLVFGAYTPEDFIRRQPSYPGATKGDVINVPCVVFRNDDTKMNFDISAKLCPPPVGACDVSFYQDLKKEAVKK